MPIYVINYYKNVINSLMELSESSMFSTSYIADVMCKNVFVDLEVMAVIYALIFVIIYHCADEVF